MTISLSNRAQCYLNLKAYPKAHADANEACTRDPTHVKSFGRRGTAHYYMHKLKLAKADFITVLRLDPENTGFLTYIKKIDDSLL
jgi:Tfp pilus assembly protein PilF